MFSTPEGRLYKQAEHKEIAFYAALTSQPDCQPLRPFVAKFFAIDEILGSDLLKAKASLGPGQCRCAASNAQNCHECALAVRLLRDFQPDPHATYSFLAVQDITQHLSKPCVLDLKMGRRQHGYGASQEKIRSKEAKALASTSHNLFFRVAGLKTYNAVSGQFRCLSKKEAVRYRPSEVQEALEAFFDNGRGLRGDVIRLVLEQLESLRDVLQSLGSWHFITSSLLVAFEGDPLRPAAAHICMVDFAHTEAVSGRIDTEYLYGLSNLMDLLSCTLARQSYCPPPTPTKRGAAEACPW